MTSLTNVFLYKYKYYDYAKNNFSPDMCQQQC